MNKLFTRLLFLLILAMPRTCAALASPTPDLPSPITLSSNWQLTDAAKIDAAGDALSKVTYKPKAWYSAVVPGTILTSLVHDGVYPDPLYGENNRAIPESLNKATYWYRTRFTLPSSYAGRRIWLNFAGINYMANIWLNGHDLGEIQGAFMRGTFDATAYAHVGQSNALAVQILPMLHPGIPHEHTMATGTGGNGGQTARDGATFLCTIGWDWIPAIRDRDMGIWQDVTLSASGPVTIQNPYITSDLPLPRTDSADLTLQTTLHNATNKPQAGLLKGAFGGTPFQAPVTLAPNETKTVTLTPATTPQLHVPHPRLWWPNGYGPQNLYTMRLRFVQNGADSDDKIVPFGIRKIQYTLPGSDNLALSVNGVPVVAKGGDWGMDEAMKRIPRSRLEAQIRMHKLANYTIIRNWVGQSTSEDFYDLCDKYGILVWDEFFQPNPGDGPNPDDVPLYMANVREKILRFRSHPCIALWCARNEGFAPPEINSDLITLLTQIDPHRLYQPSSTSGRGVHSGGPYHWRDPADFYDVDAPFKTEIGSVSIPTLESVEGMMPKKDWNSIDDDWAEHDLCGGAQDGSNYPYVLAQRYGRPVNLADFVRKSQLMNYEDFRAMYEGRFAKLFNPVTGVITWMSNPAQPSFVWQLYSHDLEPNSSLFATRLACEPIHIQMNQSDGHVMVINNTPRLLTGLTAETDVYNMDGALQYTHADPVAAASSAATDLGVIDWPASLSPVHFIRVQLLNAQKHPISDNFYWRSLTLGDFKPMVAMPTVPLTASVTSRADASNITLTVTLRNPSRTPALMAHLQLRDRRTDQRVLPVYYSDNYVSLLPGESKTITVEAAKQDLNGDEPRLMLDGWNVTVKSGPLIAPNTDADIGPQVLQADAPIAKKIGLLEINCGGKQATPYIFGATAPPTTGFVSDVYFTGGNPHVVSDKIGLPAANAAPEFVYQSERWGNSLYTIPVQSAQTYTVRLHFAETTFDKPGARLFDVAINGQKELTNFDVFAAAGGKDKGIVKDFPNTHPDPTGHIIIAFQKGLADQPNISGIEVLPN